MAKTKSSARPLMSKGAEVFGGKVHDVPADRWDAPTPCPAWSVRDVLNHVVSEHRWAPHLLHGETLAQVGNRYDGDVLGTDPVAGWDAAIAESLTAWSDASDDQTVHLSFGAAPLSEYADQMLLDLAVHAWDLAQGAGISVRLDPHLVAYVWAYAAVAIPRWQGAGIFAAPVEIDSDDLQDRLIALVGRDPSWSATGG